MFYLIQWTWGLIENLWGLVVFLIFIWRPHFKNGKSVATTIPFKLGNFSIGMFVFVEENSSAYIMKHELGHCYQTLYFGILKIFIVNIPSFFRYWFMGGKNMTREQYEKAWFERQATRLGTKYFQID